MHSGAGNQPRLLIDGCLSPLPAIASKLQVPAFPISIYIQAFDTRDSPHLRHRGAVFLEGGSSFLIWIDVLLVPAWNGQEWIFVLRHGLTASSKRSSSGTYQCRLSSPGLGLRLLSRVYLIFSAYMFRITKPDIQPPRLTFRLLSMVKGLPASGELNARRPEHKNLLQFWYHHAFIDVCLRRKSNIAWKVRSSASKTRLTSSQHNFNYHPID
jgi:hypothetical protein